MIDETAATAVLRPSSTAERAARGKAARVATPHAGHAEFEPVAWRTDPVALALALREADTLKNMVTDQLDSRRGKMVARALDMARSRDNLRRHPLPDPADARQGRPGPLAHGRLRGSVFHP